ncbi:hypothetical protein EVAR_12497_1 [Eumeta japonica]|uniref:Uncharacterized protein n=1 Tax=Eumeta variegata TaxID=151549 RepID=A0A4C1TPM8_EUMVA|nr:hypothetical protein EVAR_12497_1 [Eumeta japonica]
MSQRDAAGRECAAAALSAAVLRGYGPVTPDHRRRTELTKKIQNVTAIQGVNRLDPNRYSHPGSKQRRLKSLQPPRE